MRMIEIVEQLNSGKTIDQIEKELRVLDKKKVKEPGKIYGKCESCENLTCLVEEVGLCGPCCFGEAETANGNW